MRRGRPFLPALVLSCATGCQGTEGDVLLQVVPDLGTVMDSAGSQFSCQTSVLSAMCQAEAAWTAVAGKTCQAGGLVLNYCTLSGPCDMAGYRDIEFLCCPKEVLMGCVMETAGAPMTGCQDAAGWKLTAAKACAASQWVLQGLSLLDPCGMGQYRSAAYLCCPQGP